MNLGSAFSMLTHFETAAFAMTGLVMEYKELEGQAARAVDVGVCVCLPLTAGKCRATGQHAQTRRADTCLLPPTSRF